MRRYQRDVMRPYDYAYSDVYLGDLIPDWALAYFAYLSEIDVYQTLGVVPPDAFLTKESEEKLM